MSMTVSGHRRSRLSGPIATSSEVAAEAIGAYIHSARLMDGRPLEEIAPQAALTVPEWEAIEAGQLPGTWEHICLIGMVLGLGRPSMSWLMKIYAGTIE